MKPSLEIWPVRWMSASHWGFWDEAVATNPALSSPFFRSDFVRSVAASTPRCHAMVFKRMGAVVAILPFEVQSRNRGVLIAPDIVGQHGLIAPENIMPEIELGESVDKAGLRYLRFDQVPACQAVFDPYTTRLDNSPHLILSETMEATRACWRASGQNTFARIEYKTRKLGNRGDIMFEYDSSNPLLYRYLMTNKQKQFNRTGKPNELSAKETQIMLTYLIDERQGGCRSLLSGLYLNGAPVAAHLGLATERVFYSWYPAFGEISGNNSPGFVLFGYLIQALHEKGYLVMDFGTEPMLYKTRLTNSSHMIKRGIVRGPRS